MDDEVFPEETDTSALTSRSEAALAKDGEDSPEPHPEDIANSFRSAQAALPRPPAPDEGIEPAKEWAIMAMACGFNVSEIARAMKCSRQRILHWVQRDPEFAEAWAEAKAIFKDLLKGEAFRRAGLGYETKPGLRSYSDPLMKMMLQAEIPEEFGPKQGGAMIQINVGDVEAVRRNVQPADEPEVIDGDAILKELEG